MPTFTFRQSGKKYQVSGTAFQITVWKELLKIPRGKTAAYAAVARRIGKPRAARAVANACASNPLIRIIPCHRVIASDGSLGGYSGPGGIMAKQKLLQEEQK
jgi:methylated-DNA-[protein]-cysteine S-methyltransferase